MVSADELVRFLEYDPDENPWVIGPPAPEPIDIVSYRDEWPVLFIELDHQIRSVLGDTAIELDHIGSTSVPGLAAKDVIDMDLTVADPGDEASYVPALEGLGYVLVVRERSYRHRMFRLAEPRANLHVFGPGCPETIRHKMFRDWLRRNPDDLALYADAKRSAIPGGGGNVMEYNARKQAVVREIYDRVFRAAGLISGR